MRIKKFSIQNFKSFEDITFVFNHDLNVLTGINNSGKTTILEALALWSECFERLIHQAQKTSKGHYQLTTIHSFDQINSVRSPYFEDLFRDRNSENKITLTALLQKETEEIEISFQISDAVGKYIIELGNAIDYQKFNDFFNYLPNAIDVYYASPISFIEQEEKFVTEPLIKEAIKQRKSSSVIRNRIYKLYHSPRFSNFQSDLSYILFNHLFSTINLYNHSDIQQDSRVVINYKIGNESVEKDIALLGSGTLQTIEILLNIYQQTEQKKDLKIILLDEPDSHIHRDIQKRIIEVLTRFSDDNQLFITTHNEAFIRNTPLTKLFHIDGQAKGEVKNMYQQDLLKLKNPHFKGLYPSTLSPLIKLLGNDTGLDFINAIEAERIIFVEGDDDARVIHRLLQEYPKNHNRKMMYWVLGGISKVFDKIGAYQLFFNEIKNEKTLWEKSVLILDKDAMIDEHIQTITQKITTELKLPTFSTKAYTQEAILFTDLVKLTQLLKKYLQEDKQLIINENELFEAIQHAYYLQKELFTERYSKDKINSIYVKQYQGSYVEKTKKMFDSKKPCIENDDIKLLRALEGYYANVIQNEEYYQLMTKIDVQNVLNNALFSWDMSVDIDNEFYEIISKVTKSVWFTDWDYLKQI